MKILVTGVAGFFGSNLTEYLLAKGHTVVGIDNFNDYYNPSVKEYHIKDFVKQPTFKLYRTDILDLIELSHVFDKEGKFDAVIHLAAWAGVTSSILHPVIYVRNNIEGTVNMAELSVKHKIRCFIFASTSSVYGSNPTPFDEEMKINDPKSPYPATKRASELLLRTYSENFGLPVTILRIFNPIGKRMRPDLALSRMIRSTQYDMEFPIYQDLEKSARDYSYVGHMFDAIGAILQNPSKFEIFNLGNSAPVTLGVLMTAVEKVTGKKIKNKKMPERKGEMATTYANIEKAKKLLGYNPVTSVEESVKIFYDWYMQQDESYKKGEM